MDVENKKSEVSEVKLEEGKVSFVIQQKHLMRPEELRLRYGGLLRTLKTLEKEKQKMENIAKILKIKLD